MKPISMTYNFEPSFKQPQGTDSNAVYKDENNPRLLLTKSGLYLGEPIYQELGAPKKLNVEIDRQKKAFRLVAVTEETALKDAYSIRKFMTSPQTGSVPYYLAFTAHMRRRSTNPKFLLFQGLPFGVYKPVGGNIFELETVLAPKPPRSK